MSGDVDRVTGECALILGVSSGFGAAAAEELARRGMNIFGVHLDRKSTLPNARRIQADIEAEGQTALFWNRNAAAEETRREVVAEIAARRKHAAQPRLRVVLHSLAFGALRPYLGPAQERITRAQMEMTLDVMAHSLVYWTQDLFAADLLGPGSRVLALTSEGSKRTWPGYGAVSAAKAALEAHVRQLAFELGRQGITVNAIRAGVTDTPGARKIPTFTEMSARAQVKNPGGRLTTPADVAGMVALLAQAEAQWTTGTVIGVDGGEFNVG